MEAFENSMLKCRGYVMGMRRRARVESADILRFRSEYGRKRVNGPGQDLLLHCTMKEGGHRVPLFPWRQMLVLTVLNFSQGVMLTQPFVIAVFMVRDFLMRASPSSEVDEQTVGRLTGFLAAGYR